jgi:stress-induced morphogen
LYKNCRFNKTIGLLLIDKDRIVFPENLKRVEFCWNGKDMLRAIEFGYTTGASIADKKRDGKDFIKMLEEQHYEPTSLQVEYSSFHHDHIDGGIEYGIESAHKFVIISKVFHGESEKERELQTQEG